MRTVFLFLALAACGSPVTTKLKAPVAEPERPATVFINRVECVSAQTTANVINNGCQPYCLPQEAQRVCTDLGPRLYFPHEYPLQGTHAAILADPASGCVPGWEIVEVNPTVNHYTNKDFEWATFPDNGEPCVIDAGKRVEGWFGRVYGTLDFHEFAPAILAE